MIARRAKIVCTVGPAVDSRDAIRGLIEAGMDVARLNFSHGTHADHGRMAEMIRAESLALGKPVALLQDLCGPKIRTGKIGPAVYDGYTSCPVRSSFDQTFGCADVACSVGTAPDRLRRASAGRIQVWTYTRRVLCQLYWGSSNSAKVSVFFDLQKATLVI